MEKEIERLFERLKALEEERAVLQTLYTYGHCIDYGLEKEWVGQFASDGIFELRMRQSGNVRTFEGHAALSSFIAGHTRSPGKYHKHLLVEPMITVDGGQASVKSYFVRVDEAPDSSGAVIQSFGRYVDQLVKKDGRWLFKHRIAEVDVRLPNMPRP